MSNRPILYYSPENILCRAILLTAAEIGLDLDTRTINMQIREHRGPEFLKINPHATIPVLNDNGIVITESHVICAHLADKYSANEHLYPKDPVARNRVLTELFFNYGNLFARLRKILEPILIFGSTELSHEAIQYLKRAYDYLECCLKDSPYVCGQHMTIADLCCISSMSTARDFAPVNASKYPQLLEWMQRMSQLPYYKRCNQDGVDVLRQEVMAKLEENRKAWI